MKSKMKIVINWKVKIVEMREKRVNFALAATKCRNP